MHPHYNLLRHCAFHPAKNLVSFDSLCNALPYDLWDFGMWVDKARACQEVWRPVHSLCFNPTTAYVVVSTLVCSDIWWPFFSTATGRFPPAAFSRKRYPEGSVSKSHEKCKHLARRTHVSWNLHSEIHVFPLNAQ